MTIFEFVSLESKGERMTLLATTAVSGISNAFALMLVNAAAHAPETANARTFLVFALFVVVHLAAARRASHRGNALIEEGLHRIKTRIVEKIERAELGRLERIGTSEIFDRLTQNMAVITSASSAVGSIPQSLVIFVCSLFYIVWLSPLTFAILCPLELVALYIYRSRGEIVGRFLQEYTRARVRFLDMLNGLLRGAKEIKLHRARSQEVRKEFNQVSASLRDVSTKFTHIFDDNVLFMTCNLYLLLATLVFVLAELTGMDSATLSRLIAVILFVWGSVQSGLGWYPAYIQANHALAEINALEKKLEGAAPERGIPRVEHDPWGGEPGRIEALQIEYEYPTASGDEAFHIGPIDLTIERGEILFIVGGNGSGKSTFLKVLTGLYPPTRGALRVRGISLGSDNEAAYRELMSVIFSDFHLFSKVYGLLGVDAEAVQALLRQMQIEHKTSFKEGRFTRRDLSTGQRKRLAMIVALLEDRPILVLDEWAADQDPEFRKYFYEDLLPALKQRGKTVIAVSHDDRYFHCADRIVIMEYGKIRAIQTTHHDSVQGGQGAAPDWRGRSW